MRDLWREASPSGAIADFLTVFRQAGKNRWRFAALAALTTLGIFSVMNQESWKKQRRLPEIDYITSWPAHRTDAETQAFIAENQRRKEAREAREAAAQAEQQHLYKTLGRVSGMDVEGIEAKAKAERAAEAAKAKAETDAILAKNARDPVAGQ